MPERSIKSPEEVEKKLNNRAKTFDHHRLNAAAKFAERVAENIYAQFATGMSLVSTKTMVSDSAERIIISFSNLDKSMTAMHPALKVTMKDAAYMTFLNYLRGKDTEAASMLYNQLMTSLKARDQATYAGLIKGGYPALMV